MFWGSDFAFPIDEHKTMLQDSQRLAAYKKSMKDKVDGKTIIDVGAGTGILSLNALELGAKEAFALEEDFSTYNFVNELIDFPIKDKRLHMINASSFDFNHPITPDLVVSELIGAVGPEEGIVEAFFDLKEKYSSIREFIPTKLDVCYSFFHSDTVESDFESTYQVFSSSLPYLTTENKKELFELMYGQKFLFTEFKEKYVAIEEGICVGYDLGISQCSNFRVSLQIPNKANTLSLFFKVTLDQDQQIILSNCPGSSLHWRTPYLRIPKGKNKAIIEYKHKNNFFFIEWK